MQSKTSSLAAFFRFSGRASLLIHCLAAWATIRQVWFSSNVPTPETSHTALLVLWGLLASASLMCVLFFGLAHLLSAIVRTAAYTAETAQALDYIINTLRPSSTKSFGEKPRA